LSPCSSVRFLLGDTESSFPLLQDEEILACLTEENESIKMAAIRGCQFLIAKFSKQVNYTVGPEKVEAGERVKAFRALLKDLKGNANFSLPQADTTQPTFNYGMNDYR
jgi:hypothetical protein